MDNPQEHAPPPISAPVDYARIAAGKQFQDLLAVKRLFIIPAFVFFFLNLIGFAILVGYTPKLASSRVIGTVNVAYLFALLQFVLGWTIAGLYLSASPKFDRLTKDVLEQVGRAQTDHGQIDHMKIDAARGGQ